VKYRHRKITLKPEVKIMKVRVDPELCTGDEICTQTCPEVFEMQGDKAVAKMEEVPENLEACAKEGAESCPSDAIIIEE
jgi:ferredoxin